jgi:hypothetical protein
MCRLDSGPRGGLGGGRSAHLLWRGLGNGHGIGGPTALKRSGRLFGLDGIGDRTGDRVNRRSAILVVVVRGNTGLP